MEETVGMSWINGSGLTELPDFRPCKTCIMCWLGELSELTVPVPAIAMSPAVQTAITAKLTATLDSFQFTPWIHLASSWLN